MLMVPQFFEAPHPNVTGMLCTSRASLIPFVSVRVIETTSPAYPEVGDLEAVRGLHQ